jgi:hypothetical protein
MMDKCREEFEKWEKSIGGAGYDYDVWQAAWNARQPEVKMLDLGGLESHTIVEWYTMWGASDEQELVRYSDLTNAAKVPVPTVEELADHIDAWFKTGEDKPWSFIVEDLAGSIHSMLTKGRGGV